MKRTGIALICFLLSLSVSSAFAVTDCVSTLTPDLKLHVPVLGFGSDLFSVDMQYVPSSDGNIWLNITNVGAPDKVACDNASALAVISDSIQIYVPSLTVGGTNYWLTFEYVPQAAVAPLPMRLKAAGDAGLEPLAPLVPDGPTNLHFWSAFQGKITGPDIDMNFKSFQFNIAVASDQSLGTPQITDNGAWLYPPQVSELSIKKVECWVGPPINSMLSECGCTASIPSDSYNKHQLKTDSLGIANPNSSNPLIRLFYFVDPFDMHFDVKCKINGTGPFFITGGTYNFPYLLTHKADVASSLNYIIDHDQWTFYKDPQWRQVIYAFKNYFDATGTMRQGSELLGIHTVNVTEVVTAFDLEK